jgi:hypothetical protein
MEPPDLISFFLSPEWGKYTEVRSTLTVFLFQLKIETLRRRTLFCLHLQAKIETRPRYVVRKR